MDFDQELFIAIKSGARVISVNSPERNTFYQRLGKFVLEESEKNGETERIVFVSTNQKLQYFDWDMEELRDLSQSENQASSRIATQLDSSKFSHKTISAYRSLKPPGIKTCMVIEDAKYQLGDKDVFLELRSFTDPKQNPYKDRVIFLLSESRLELEELVNEVIELKIGYPNKEELEENIMFSIAELGMNPGDITGDISKLVEAARGLTLVDTENTIKQAAVRNKMKLPVGSENEIMASKKKIIATQGTLEFIESPVSKDDVGGLDILMDWLEKRANLLGKRPVERNIPSPKGVLFIGVPGSGKSLTAKVVSTIFSRPLIRFDVAACYGGYVGESEESLRKSLDIAEAVSPCVLWIDELDKALAGGASGGGDSGVSARVFGSLLTWMSEKSSDVFIVATANNIDSILKTNPELFRKGRFDQIFFLDYPSPEVREEIFRIHLQKLAKHAETGEVMKDSINIELLDLEELASKTNNWTGSEIEYAVIGALISAYAQGDQVVRQEDLLEYIENNPSEFSRMSSTDSDGDNASQTRSGLERMRKMALKVGISASSD